MATFYHREHQTKDFDLQPKKRRLPVFLLNLLVMFGLFLLLVFLTEGRLPFSNPASPVTPLASKEPQLPASSTPALPASSTEAPQSFGSVDSQPALDRYQSYMAVTEEQAERKMAVLPVQALEPVQHVPELDTLVAQFKNIQTLTPESAKELNRLLKDLLKQGGQAVPAIRDLLRSKMDISFDKMKGGELAAFHTLRQALFDTLRQIGGPEAMATLVEQLGGNQDPAEIAALARNLEQAEPGVYQPQILQATTNALQLYAHGTPPVEIRPLFEVLQEVGGPQAASILAQYPTNATSLQYVSNKDPNISPTVKMYALISLASLPDGEGVNSLVALAGDPRVPTQSRADLPFQMLAQTAMEHEEAGRALLKLAKDGQIPNRAWSAVGEALQGRYILFPSQMTGGVLPGQNNEVDRSEATTPFIRAFYDDEKNLKYEQRLVSADWSPEQVAQQQKLIDDLLNVTSSPAGKEALHNARAALQGDRVASLQ